MTFASFSEEQNHLQQVTSAFTCASCQRVFSDYEAQRQHYQSDWHRFNLKRKIRDLPPVLEETFLSLLNQKCKAASEAAEKEKPTTLYCIPCKKSFSSIKSATSHTQSRRHLDTIKCNPLFQEDVIKVKTTTKTTNKDFIAEEEAQAFIENKLSNIKRLTHLDCLFCAENNFITAKDNLEHMKKCHSLFIPDHQYLTDLEGLLDFLAEKVSVFNECIWCPSSRSSFQSCGLSGLRKHMADKGHQKIRFEEDDGRADIECFYTYPSVSRERMIIFNDDSDSEYEDIDEIDGEEGVGKSGDAKATITDYEGDERTLFISPDESEMLLPNGKKIGSRQYRIYYRQHLRDPTRLPSIRVLNSNSSSTLLLVDGTERNLSINETMQQRRKGLVAGGIEVAAANQQLLRHPSALQHRHFDERLGEFEDSKRLFVRGQRDERGDRHRLSLKTGMIQNVMRCKFFRHQLLQ